jgi:ATP-dependent DNA ligase
MPRLLPAGFVAPCQPSPVLEPPAGADWLHEIKHDGFRLMVHRNGGRVRRPAARAE